MEADIIANAGLPSAVTIATNMAGRGTDIVLGEVGKLKLRSWKIQQKSKLKRSKHNGKNAMMRY